MRKLGDILLKEWALVLTLVVAPTISLQAYYAFINLSIAFLQPEIMLRAFVRPVTYVLFFTPAHILENKVSWLLWGAILIQLLLSLVNRMFPTGKIKDSFEDSELYGSHGTARWLGEKELKKEFFQTDKLGWFLGSLKADNYRLNGNYAVHNIKNPRDLNMQFNIVGPPGSKKTTGFVYPAIFHIPQAYKKAIDEHADFIITDPKSELWMWTAKYLEEQGYDVHVLDFIHLKYGDKFNPIPYIQSDTHLIQLATNYVEAVAEAKNKGNGGSNTEPIWVNGETLLFGALLGFVLQKYGLDKQTFQRVSELLTSKDVRDEHRAERFFENNGITGAPEQMWRRFLLLEDKVRSGVLAGLATSTLLFSIDSICEITSTSTFDIAKFGAKKERPMALFIWMPDQDRTFAPIINMIVSVLFKQLYQTAYHYGNKLPNPVYMIIEEIANIGKIPDLQEMLGTMRGRRIYPMMIWQSLSQMKDRYGDNFEDIIAQCDTKIYLGANDKFTAEYISETLGKKTIRVQGESLNEKKTFLDSAGRSLSDNYQERPLLFPDEVVKYDNNRFIMMQRTLDPISLYKVQYKYWEEKERIAPPARYEDLPLLKPQQPANTEELGSFVDEKQDDEVAINSMIAVVENEQGPEPASESGESSLAALRRLRAENKERLEAEAKKQAEPLRSIGEQISLVEWEEAFESVPINEDELLPSDDVLVPFDPDAVEMFEEIEIEEFFEEPKDEFVEISEAIETDHDDIELIDMPEFEEPPVEEVAEEVVSEEIEGSDAATETPVKIQVNIKLD